MSDILQNPCFTGAFLLMMVCIFAGYLFRRFRVVGEEGKKAITAVVWKLGLPCLAFTSFQRDFSLTELRNGLSVLLASALFYFIFIVFGRLLFAKAGKTKAKVAALMGALGQLTLFTLPLLRSLGDEETVLFCNMMTLSFRGVLYFAALPLIMGCRQDGNSPARLGSAVKKVFLNPVMPAMLLGFAIWLTQGILPRVDGVCCLRLDLSLPGVFDVMSKLSDLVCPLAMLLIGLSMGACPLSRVLTDFSAWGVALFRTVFVPLTVYAVTKSLPGIFPGTAVAALTLGFAAPASVTVCTFCAEAGTEEEFAARSAALTALLCLLTVPVFYVLPTA
ncbi:MAG: AEC family transporter [Clostridia bacterium]|nr:AEC family transporter [Clostridia bacterium]